LIADRFIEEGIPIKGIIGLGGVAKKSPFIMQMMADVLNMPIKIAASDQTCALGAAMFAAVAAGIHPDIGSAMNKMGSGFDAEYHPNFENAKSYETFYQNYKMYSQDLETLQMRIKNQV
jgi:L-ribulokinase